MSNLKKIFQYWYVPVAFMLLGALVGFLTQKDEYESSASLMFKLGREHLYQPEFGNRQPIASTRSDMANAINTETHIMSSTDVLRIAVNKIGAENILDDATLLSETEEELVEQQAIDLLSKELSIRSIEGTNVLKLSFAHQSPLVAKDTLSAIIDAFLQYRKELYSDSSLFLMQQKLDENRESLKSAEDELQVFSSEHNIYSFDEQLNLVTKQLIEGDQNRQNLAAEKSQIELQLQLTSERINNTAKSISLYTETATNALVDDAKSRLFELQVERNQLRGKYHDGSERVTQLQNEIAQLNGYINSQDQFTTRSERKGRNPALDSLVSRKIKLENQRDEITSRQQSLNALMTNLRKKRNELKALSVEYERKQSVVTVLKERQLVYLAEVDRAELAVDVSKSVRSGARVLQSASLPTTRSGVTGWERIQLSGLVGLLLGIALLMVFSILKAFTIFPAFTNTAEKINTKKSLDTIDDVETKSSQIDKSSTEGDKDISEVTGITVLGKITRA